MVRGREKTFEIIFAVYDILVTIISLLISISVYYNIEIPSHPTKHEYTILILVIIPVWYVLINVFNQNKMHRVRPYSVVFIDYFFVVSIGIASLLLIIFILKLSSISRISIFLFGSINFALLFFSKIGLLYFFKYYRKRGYNFRYVMIIADDNAGMIIDKLISNTFWGYKIKVIITDSEILTQKYINDYTVLPMNTNIEKFIEMEAVDEVILCNQNTGLEELRKLIYSCQEIGVTFRLQSQIFNLIASKSHVSFFEEIPFFTFSKTPNTYLTLKIKEVFDFCFSLFVLTVTSPFLVLIAVLIKTSSKGPVLFGQERIGLRGRKFKLYKFRTMVQNAEELKEKLMHLNEQKGPVFKMKNDPRITKIGRFLRKTSLDEFPQFINILKGDMSVVGPRPPIESEVKQYERWQLRRLSMKPGITCIWQVSGRNNISFDEWMRMDLQYIDTWSLRNDLIIILKTIRTVLRADGH